MSFEFNQWDMDDELFAGEDDKDAAADFESGDADEDNFIDPDADLVDEFDDILGDVKKFTEITAKDWHVKPHSKMPKVTFDSARRQVWEHGKKEIRFFKEQVDSQFDPGLDTDKFDTIVRVLAGPDSPTFHSFKQIIGKATHLDFTQWLSAFFFSCHMNKNYGKLSASDRVNTGGFADIDDYDEIWRKMELYAKGNRFQKHSWKEFEEALNKTLKCNFFPDPSKLNLQICLDDDKALFAHGLLREMPVDEDSDLARVRHVKENRTGFNCHCACLAATGIPIGVGFQKVVVK